MSAFKSIACKVACVAAALIVSACTGEAPPLQPPAAVESANVLTLAPEQGGTDYVRSLIPNEDPSKSTYGCDSAISTPVALNLTDGASVMNNGASMKVKNDGESVVITIERNVFVSSMVVNNTRPVKIPTDRRTEQTLTVKLNKVDFGSQIGNVEVCYYKLNTPPNR